MDSRVGSAIRTVLVAALAGFGVSLVAPSADACGGDFWPELVVDHRVQGIAGAEKDLAEGRHLAAAGKVIRMIPHIRAYSESSTDRIVNRSMRVLAVASVREGGDLSRLMGELPEASRALFAGDTEEARTANLKWSILALKALRRSNKDDVTLKTELAEAMAALPETKAKARKTLESLARKDLITTPEGYRVLGRLRSEAGNEDGAAQAIQRCRTMARDSAICGPVESVPGQS